MGGQKFETTEPQKFLFGSVSDLNYLGPYGPTGSSEHNLPKVNHRLSNNRPGYVQEWLSINFEQFFVLYSSHMKNLI